MKPYSRSFETGIGKIVDLLKRQNLAIQIIFLFLGVTGLFTALFFLAGLLSLPVTALGMLEREKINLLHCIPEFFIILFSQFTLVRYIRSLESRRMTLTVSDAIARSLQNDVISILKKVKSGILDEKEMDCVHLRTMMTSLLEARMFTTVVSDIFGLFPVYLFKPDLTLITDDEMLKILRGHMSLMPRSPGKQEKVPLSVASAGKPFQEQKNKNRGREMLSASIQEGCVVIRGVTICNSGYYLHTTVNRMSYLGN